MSDEREEPFDLERLQQLIEMMEKHDLRQVKLQRGDQKWELRRGPQEMVHTAAAHVPAALAPVPAAGPAGDGSPGDNLADITSPMVGTFYRSPSPGEPVFVKEGDRVTTDTVVCLIEAMKFFNQIKAERSGTIVKVLVSDGDAVDYGQALLRIKPE